MSERNSKTHCRILTKPVGCEKLSVRDLRVYRTTERRVKQNIYQPASDRFIG